MESDSVPAMPDQASCSSPGWRWLPFVSRGTLAVALFLPYSSFGEPPVKVEWKGGLVTVVGEKGSLCAIVQEVARQAGIEVQGVDKLQEQVSVNFSGLPLFEALQRLLKDTDYALWGVSTHPGSARSVRLVIFGEKRAPGSRVFDAQSSGELSHATTNAEASYEEPRIEDEAADDTSEEGLDDRARQLAAVQRSALHGKVDSLREAVLDQDLAVQKAAFEALAQVDPKGAVAALASAARSDDPGLRVQAIQLLAAAFPADEEAALAALRDALTLRDPEVQSAAIQALATQGGSQAMGLLREGLHDPDPSVRMMVIQSVAQAENGLPLLQDAAADSDESVHAFVSTWLSSTSSAPD